MIKRVFSDIYGNVGNNIQDTSSNTQTIIKGYCNSIYFDILKRVNFEDVNTSYSFSTVAGQQDYPLPNNFGKPVYVYNATYLTELSAISLQELVKDYQSSLSSSGVPTRYVLLKSMPVRRQPTSASTLSIVSSSASDTTQIVRVKGYTSNGVEVDESVTLTGTSAVATTNSYTEIRSISKSATTTGYITITSNSGAVTVAVLGSGDTAYSVNILRLHYIPNGIVTINCPYIVDPSPLTNDLDQPVIDCAVAIELGATMMAWRYKRQFSKANEYERQYERAIDTLVWDLENSSTRQRMMGITPYSRDNV